MIVITPCTRPSNLQKLYGSIKFEHIRKWIIVYDGNKVGEVSFAFDDDKIIECISYREGMWGNPMRNEALDICETLDIEDDYIYFLDDDTIAHPNLWRIIKNTTYPLVTFDMTYLNGRIIQGCNPKPHKIDTSMFLVKHSLINGKRWNTTLYYADGVFIESIYKECKENWEYIPVIGSYYNRLR